MFVNKIYIVVVLVSSHLFSQIPDAIGRNGAVSSSNEYATQIGIDILKSGVNATPSNKNGTSVKLNWDDKFLYMRSNLFL